MRLTEVHEKVENQLKNLTVGFSDKILIVDENGKNYELPADMRSLIRMVFIDHLYHIGVLGEAHEGYVDPEVTDIHIERNNSILMFHVERKEQ